MISTSNQHHFMMNIEYLIIFKINVLSELQQSIKYNVFTFTAVFQHAPVKTVY